MEPIYPVVVKTSMYKHFQFQKNSSHLLPLPRGEKGGGLRFAFPKKNHYILKNFDVKGYGA
jgi:hypothetical protein